jgi:hypothetical protein
MWSSNFADYESGHIHSVKVLQYCIWSPKQPNSPLPRHTLYAEPVCKRLRSPGIDYKESIPPAYVVWRTCTSKGCCKAKMTALASSFLYDWSFYIKAATYFSLFVQKCQDFLHQFTSLPASWYSRSWGRSDWCNPDWAGLDPAPVCRN